MVRTETQERGHAPHTVRPRDVESSPSGVITAVVLTGHSRRCARQQNGLARSASSFLRAGTNPGSALVWEIDILSASRGRRWMRTRRHFLTVTFGGVLGGLTLLQPLLPAIQRVWAASKKVL